MSRSSASLTVSLALCGLVALVYGVLDTRRLSVYAVELDLWEDAVIHQPNDPSIQVALGVQLEQVGRSKEAIEHFERALELDPTFYLAHYNLGCAMEEQDRVAAAIEHYEAALSINPDLANAHANLGGLLAAEGKTATAIEHFQRALERDPNLAVAHNNLAIALLNVGEVTQAIEHFEKAMRLRPEASTAVNLANAYVMAGRAADAVVMGRQSARAGPRRGAEQCSSSGSKSGCGISLPKRPTRTNAVPASAEFAITAPSGPGRSR